MIHRVSSGKVGIGNFYCGRAGKKQFDIKKIIYRFKLSLKILSLMYLINHD